MRDIKFRSWEKDYLGIHTLNYIPYIKEPDGRPHDYVGISDLNLSIKNEIIDGNIIMQFTGLKDKNGKEIYEGDIIKSNTYPEIKETLVSWNGPAVTYTAWLCSLGNLTKGYDIEVIGNIYENPELLSEEENEQSQFNRHRS